jgi:uncharacterized protein (DUF305 family)
MKKAFMLAGFATIAISCNNNSNSNANDTDSTHHGVPHGTASDAKNQDQMNPITETMDKMMHAMHNAKPTGNNDVDFAVMMVEHHKGAVDMSKVEVARGNDTEMKSFAQKVIDDQNKEIEFMQGFILKAPETTSSNSADFQKGLNGSMMAMMNDNTTIYNDIDKDFAAQMIPHHQSAVDMAKAYLAFGHDKSLKALCENIIRSQTTEIKWLREWLAKRTN